MGDIADAPEHRSACEAEHDPLYENERIEPLDRTEPDGPTERIQQWFEEFGNHVYGYLVYSTGTTDVEDLVQDTFVRAFQAMPTYEEQGSPLAWLISIARNLTVDAARKRQRRARLHTETRRAHEGRDPLEQIMSPERPLDEVVADRDALHHVFNLIHEVSPKYLDVLILRGIQDLPPEDVARVLKCSTGNVNVIYHRALKAARRLLQENNEHGTEGRE